MARGDGILPGYRGHVDAIEPVLPGWEAEIERPTAPVSFFLSIDRSHRIPVIADRLRAVSIAMDIIKIWRRVGPPPVPQHRQ